MSLTSHSRVPQVGHLVIVDHPHRTLVELPDRISIGVLNRMPVDEAEEFRTNKVDTAGDSDGEN